MSGHTTIQPSFLLHLRPDTGLLDTRHKIHDFDTTSMQTLRQAMEVRPGGLYAAFSDKRDCSWPPECPPRFVEQISRRPRIFTA
jgi:hypothetical protein